jgi:hypothetical protein
MLNWTSPAPNIWPQKRLRSPRTATGYLQTKGFHKNCQRFSIPLMHPLFLDFFISCKSIKVSDLARCLVAVENLNLDLRLRTILQLIVWESFRIES